MGYISSRTNYFALAARRARALLPLLGALLLVPATNAFAAEPAPPEPVATEPAATEPAPAPADETASKPAATVAQAPEDISGGNEYTEQAPPTGTGEPAPPEEPEPTPEPTPTAPAPVTGAADTAPTATAETTAATEGLPRTGLDGWPIAIVGFALLGLGIAIRRAAATTASV